VYVEDCGSTERHHDAFRGNEGEDDDDARGEDEYDSRDQEEVHVSDRRKATFK